MASETEPDGIGLNSDCEIDEDTALSPMSSLLVPEIALSDGNFDEGNDEFDGINGQNSSNSSQMNGIRSYKCDVCAKEFKRKAHLRRHYRLHTGERPYACHSCPLTFARSEQRNQHTAREVQFYFNFNLRSQYEMFLNRVIFSIAGQNRP